MGKAVELKEPESVLGNVMLWPDVYRDGCEKDRTGISTFQGFKAIEREEKKVVALIIKKNHSETTYWRVHPLRRYGKRYATTLMELYYRPHHSQRK